MFTRRGGHQLGVSFPSNALSSVWGQFFHDDNSPFSLGGYLPSHSYSARMTSKLSTHVTTHWFNYGELVAVCFQHESSVSHYIELASTSHVEVFLVLH